MITGVNDIELIPPYDDDIDISNRIKKLFREAKSIRAAIAFWTISPTKLVEIADFNAYTVLKNRDSFLCVDIQLPTNIDYLKELAEKGVSVYLNMRRLNKNLKKISSSVGLLHTKILLADKVNDEAEFWIGSHNWTEPSLTGPNIEASLILHLYNKAPLYRSAEAMLEDIRNKYCRKFELEKVDYYKELQKYLSRIEKGENIIELEGNEVDNLGGKVICIFGTENKDFEAVSTVGKSIFVSIHDSMYENVKYLYQSEILQSGRLKSYDPAAGGIEITAPYRHAFTERGRFPFLKEEREIENEVYEKAVYFTKLKLHKLRSSQYVLLDMPRKKTHLWVEAESDPIEERMKKAKMYFGRDAKSLILVPADDERAKKLDLEKIYKLKELSLPEKRATKEYSLISKREIR